ncbi:hypothetical protein MLD38_036827 [Melastoma candidum]|uniref:Uncharacterized protein n=1 Tax=Melastoma candidum TaxID=119954 RepID=A0ACB9LKU2_9MYRT|nr:hypothetical protein MLD38_036827 [Melastoma candidum]
MSLGTTAAATKKGSPIRMRHVFWILWRAVLLLSVSLCLLALLRLHRTSTATSTAAAVDDDDQPAGPPKLAFLFLARRNLPLDFLWNSFFENGDAGNFTVYVHSQPGFVFDESTTRSRFFYGRQLPHSIQVGWGDPSMIAAEKLLFAEALKDPANQRFVLLSDSCVPLYNFGYIYNYLMASPRSFVDSFVDDKEDHYHPDMSSIIPQEKWRKGSQWIALVRKHAKVIVADEVVLAVFRKFCKKLQKVHNCIPDEHYVQTLLALKELEPELERRPVTYTLWNYSTGKRDKKDWHPFTFTYPDASPLKIGEIKGVDNIYHASEERTETCRVGSSTVPCFLFARKFTQGAAAHLLSEDIVGHRADSQASTR